MIKIKNVLVLLLVLTIGAVTACKDDSGESVQEMRTRQLTTANGWKVTTVALAPTTDYTLAGQTVTFMFNSNGSYTATNTAALPDLRTPFESIPASGQWAFADNTDFNTIRLTGTTTSGAAATPVLTITELTDTKLIATYEAAAPKQGDDVVVTLTMTAQ